MKTKLSQAFAAIVVFILSHPAMAQLDVAKLTTGAEPHMGNRPIVLMLGLVFVTLLPFIGMMATSFVKMAVVLSITRQAIGVQQTPPTTVITGLSILLTIYVMQPVGMEIYRLAQPEFAYQSKEFVNKDNVDVLIKAIGHASGPVKNFLRKQASEKNVQMFYRIAQRMRSASHQVQVAADDFIVLVPSFVISELTKAFQIGFIIFLPFLVVDMAVANILMALGMQMLSPTTVSLPFKILLFVMVDGWHLITKGLVLGYQL